MSPSVTLVAREVTRKRAVAADVFAEAPVGLAVLDLAGVVTDINPAFLDLLGLERKAVRGRPFTDFIARENRGELDRRLSKLILGTSRSARIDAARLRVTGGETEVDLSVAPRLRNREAVGLIISAFAARHAQVADSTLAQAQKMQAVGQLAGGIAHDFNNLLTAMLGFSELLLTRHGPGEPSYDDIVQIHRNAERAAGLVKQLLAFSRRQTLAPVEFDPATAIADLSRMLARLLGPAVELCLDPSEGTPRIRVDPVQFDQVIVNLAINARDAMPRGGTLTITNRPLRIDAPTPVGAETMPAGDYVLIKVADTGVGIGEDVLGHVFEPFFTTKAAGAGTGLGLSTVHGIVRQTNGFVMVDSAPGHGTTFSIYLPAVAPPPATAGEGLSRPADPAPAPVPDRQTARPVTILLVEDEPGVRDFAARVLRRGGHRVLTAGDGEEALRVFDDGPGTIDLLVSDIMMPGMDGYTLARLLGERLGRVGVIFMSGFAEDVIAPGESVSAHFLMKPFTLDELAEKVAEVIAAAPG